MRPTGNTFKRIDLDIVLVFRTEVTEKCQGNAICCSNCIDVRLRNGSRCSRKPSRAKQAFGISNHRGRREGSGRICQGVRSSRPSDHQARRRPLHGSGRLCGRLRRRPALSMPNRVSDRMRQSELINRLRYDHWHTFNMEDISASSSGEMTSRFHGYSVSELRIRPKSFIAIKRNVACDLFAPSRHQYK